MPDTTHRSRVSDTLAESTGRVAVWTLDLVRRQLVGLDALLVGRLCHRALHDLLACTAVVHGLSTQPGEVLQQPPTSPDRRTIEGMQS
jgi:hypothetical protein